MPTITCEDCHTPFDVPEGRQALKETVRDRVYVWEAAPDSDQGEGAPLHVCRRGIPVVKKG